jgi:hypothetical protein
METYLQLLPPYEKYNARVDQETFAAAFALENCFGCGDGHGGGATLADTETEASEHESQLRKRIHSFRLVTSSNRIPSMPKEVIQALIDQQQPLSTVASRGVKRTIPLNLMGTMVVSRSCTDGSDSFVSSKKRRRAAPVTDKGRKARRTSSTKESRRKTHHAKGVEYFRLKKRIPESTMQTMWKKNYMAKFMNEMWRINKDELIESGDALISKEQMTLLVPGLSVKEIVDKIGGSSTLELCRR